MEDSTKNRILRAATSLFAQGGLEGVSIRAISGRAGVNVAAVNYHFHSKEQLYLGIIRGHFQRLGEFTRELDARQLEDEEEYIRHFVHHTFELLFSRDRDLEMIITRELSIPSPHRDQLVRDFFEPGLRSLIAMIDRGIARSRFRPVCSELSALSLVGLCVFMANKRDILEQLLETDTFSEDFRHRVTEHTVELFLRGIRRDKRKRKRK